MTYTDIRFHLINQLYFECLRLFQFHRFFSLDSDSTYKKHPIESGHESTYLRIFEHICLCFPFVTSVRIKLQSIPTGNVPDRKMQFMEFVGTFSAFVLVQLPGISAQTLDKNIPNEPMRNNFILQSK